MTTFSIANDVAKYFAIIRRCSSPSIPAQALNVMPARRRVPSCRPSSSALIIIALIPLALRGVRYRPVGASTVLLRNLFVYGVGGIVVPFVGIKLIDMAITAIGLA